MIKTTTDILIEKVKSGEKVICPKCKNGFIVCEQKEGYKYPDVYCNNPECDAKLMFD